MEGFEVMKGSVSWDMTPCSQLKVSFKRITRPSITEDTALLRIKEFKNKSMFSVGFFSPKTC
jgi:hypothetical protein